MRRSGSWIAIYLVAMLAPGFAPAKDKVPKPGPVTGTWECTSHGGPRSDMPFTLYLEQEKENVTGSVSSPIGGTEITSATFKNHRLEIHIDTPQGNYLLTGKLKKSQLSGEWSIDSGSKGAWEGKKIASRMGQ